MVNSTFNQPPQSRRSIQKPLHQNEHVVKNIQKSPTPKNMHPRSLLSIKLITRRVNQRSLVPWRIASFRSWKGRNSRVDPQIFGGVNRWWRKLHFPSTASMGLAAYLPTWMVGWYIYLHGTDIFTHMDGWFVWCSCKSIDQATMDPSMRFESWSRGDGKLS